VKIFTTKAMIMMEMEQHIKPELKNSYDFAMSSFARMYGVKSVQSNNSMHRFCILWAESSLDPPLDSLTIKINSSRRVCRSVVCGGDIFIPDSEYQGEDCKLTCSIKGNESNDTKLC
jgi:hypothetical protein